MDKATQTYGTHVHNAMYAIKYHTGLPTMEQLLTELYEISEKWYIIGTALGLSTEVLISIKEEYGPEDSMCLVNILDIWLTKTTLPSWIDIANMLNGEVSEAMIAKRIINDYL